MVQHNSTNTYGVASWVVSPDATQGTHTTIQSAINSASSGDLIFLRSGTYTENLTLKAGVTISALRGSGKTVNITILGNSTFTGAGIVTISNVRLQTNGASCLSVTGSSASVLNLLNCDIQVTNGTGITFSSSNASAQIVLNNCSGDIAGSFAFLAHSSAGTFDKRYTEITNSAGSTVASTASAGFFNCRWSKKSSPITTSSTCIATVSYCIFDCNAINATAATWGGTSTTSKYNFYLGGTASAISVGGTMNSYDDTVTSSNTNAITGGGTLNYIGTVFAGSSSTVNTTTKTGVGQPSANGTAGQVLTSNGAGTIPTYQAAASGGITTINGDSGSITGSTVTIKAGVSTQNCGSSVSFVNSGTTSTLNVTDANNNTIIGAAAGNATISGSGNVIVGAAGAPILTSGINNTAMGPSTLQFLTTGSYNTCYGRGSGSNYTGAESSNILLGNVNGVVGESNVIRIGSQGSGTAQQNKCFVAGITGVAVSSLNVVTIDTSTGQLGSQSSLSTGAWILIQTQTASNSASLAFTTGITTTYNTYVLVVDNYVPATNTTNLLLQISTNGGSSYINSGYQTGVTYFQYNSTTVNNANSTTSFLLNSSIPSTTDGCSGVYFLYGFTANTANVRPSYGASLGGRTGGAVGMALAGGNYAAASTLVNAFQIISSSGNLSTGTFTLYGILE